MATDCGEGPNPDEVEALFPEGSVPENRVTAASALCSYYGRRLQVTGMLRQVLAQHFADVQHVEEMRLRTKLESVGPWKPTADTGIVIESNSRWSPDLTENRPGIIIKPNPWRWRRELIGNLAGEDEETGADAFMGFWVCSHTFFAITTQGAETEILASEVTRVLRQYAKIWVEELGMQKFEIVDLGDLGQVKEAANNWIVPVTVAYVMEEHWEVMQHAPRLKRIVFTTDGFK